MVRFCSTEEADPVEDEDENETAALIAAQPCALPEYPIHHKTKKPNKLWLIEQEDFTY